MNKRLLRLAAAVRAELVRRQAVPPSIELPEEAWGRCVLLRRQCRRAEYRAWHLAAAELRRDLAYAVADLKARVDALATAVPCIDRTSPIASVSDLYEDLLSLGQEFDQLDFDVRGGWLSVTTETVTLQGIYLGPFEIRLDWRRVTTEPAYRVIARDPHPAESRENVTHPHVMDERMCEGEGRMAIRQALQQGRLLDFFTLVARGLRTYNADSPFVGLEIWYGATCADCGAVVNDDEGYACELCSAVVCGGCESSCGSCEDHCCSECSNLCAVCNDNYCRRCLQPCAACRQRVCGDCLNQDERCTNCHEEDEPTPDAAAAEAAVQPHGLGQAPVSAGCG
jgi:hypothetical protein